jgi:lysophospholipase L1-like esterase
MNRFRIATLLAGLALVLAAAPAHADDNDRGGYLATGDSVAFGFDPLADPSDADNFTGYPEALAEMLDIDVVNSSCPGEASGGFISLTGVDNSCRPYRAAFPLHVSYSTSQLDFVVAYLGSHRNTRLVTIDIGANDLFVLIKSCPPPPDQTACVLKGLPAMLKALGQNLVVIYTAMRRAGFQGQLVGVTYYSTDYRDPVGVAIIQAVNGVVAQATTAAGGRVADGFGAFRAIAASSGGDTCAAGLLIRLTPTSCDIHPSPLGRDTLALAIGAVVSVPPED